MKESSPLGKWRHSHRTDFCQLLSGTSHGTNFGFTMEFFAEIVKDESKFNTNGRNPIITLSKKEKEDEYWPRLLKEKTKNARITVDWNKWVDEDEEAEAPEMGGDFDPSAMNAFGGGAGGMPGMPGMGGMGGMPGMGGMGGMGGMPGMGGMGGMPGMEGMGGAGGMDMAALMQQMQGMGMGGGPGGMPDSDDEEEEEAEGEPKLAADNLGDLDGEAEK